VRFFEFVLVGIRPEMICKSWSKDMIGMHWEIIFLTGKKPLPFFPGLIGTLYSI